MVRLVVWRMGAAMPARRVARRPVPGATFDHLEGRVGAGRLAMARAFRVMAETWGSACFERGEVPVGNPFLRVADHIEEAVVTGGFTRYRPDLSFVRLRSALGSAAASPPRIAYHGF